MARSASAPASRSRRVGHGRPLRETRGLRASASPGIIAAVALAPALALASAVGAERARPRPAEELALSVLALAGDGIGGDGGFSYTQLRDGVGWTVRFSGGRVDVRGGEDGFDTYPLAAGIVGRSPGRVTFHTAARIGPLFGRYSTIDPDHMSGTLWGWLIEPEFGIVYAGRHLLVGPVFTVRIAQIYREGMRANWLTVAGAGLLLGARF